MNQKFENIINEALQISYTRYIQNFIKQGQLQQLLGERM